MKIQSMWFEIKSHAPLLLTIITFSMLFFWILPLAVSDIMFNRLIAFTWTIYDYMYITIVIILASLRLVIIVEYNK